MTKEEILNMPAGSEINALFAELVMEWKKEKYQGVWGESFYWIDSQNSMKHIGDCFCPSTNISHAFEGMKKWKEVGEGHDLAEILIDLLWPPVELSTKGRHPLAVVTDLLLKVDALAITRALILWATQKEATNVK